MPHSPTPDPQEPQFLTLLDAAVGSGVRLFAEHALQLFARVRPQSLHLLGGDAFPDMVQSVIKHCIDNDCRVLRKYRPRPGVPFDAWLLSVAANLGRDIYRREMARLRRETLWSEEEQRRRRAGVMIPSHELESGRRAFEGLTPKCRLLLMLVSEGYRPQEIAQLVRLALDLERYTNVQASNDLRHCRRTFEAKLGSKVPPDRRGER